MPKSARKSYVLTVARQARDTAKHAFRSVQLRKGLARLESSLRAGRRPKLSLLEQLVHGWGNEAWSATAPFLDAIVEWLPQTNGSILECGSGLSTLLLGTGALLAGRRVHSLEHDAEWALLIRRRLPERVKSHVSICTVPLKSFEGFHWYAIEPGSIPAQIGFVVCDGPPANTPGGRYGLGPVLGSHLAAGCIILLDDTQRAGEREIVNRWCKELGVVVVREGGTYTVLRVGQALPGT